METSHFWEAFDHTPPSNHHVARSSHMANVLGINAVFHDPAAALVVDGRTIAANEEERLSRRKHGKSPVPFSTWELPTGAIGACLDAGGLTVADLDAVAYSYDPCLAAPTPDRLTDLPADEWEGLRTLFATRADRFAESVLPGFAGEFHHVSHHLAHAISAAAAAPFDRCAVMVLDGRGERGSYLAGVHRDGVFEAVAEQRLPHSLGLRYEELTEHLGFRRSSDEYKVMALASYGEPAHLAEFRHLFRVDDHGGFVTEPVEWDRFAPRLTTGGELSAQHADLASTVQVRLEEMLLELARWLAVTTGERDLAMAGGVALNCVANTRLYAEGPFERIWVQPAAGDAGTALGAAMATAAALGDTVTPMESAALGRGWCDDEIEAMLRRAALPFERPADVAATVADALAADQLVAWFQGRSEFGPRALGHRSLLAHPGYAENLERLNDVKGREQFRPVAPMVPLERAAEIFGRGPIPSPFMLFTHDVRPEWRDRIPAVVHVDGTARIQTVAQEDEPLVHRMLTSFHDRTGIPVVVNTSLNTAGRPMVDHPLDALECFGSAPIDVLALGPFVVRRNGRVA
jgi:carbamoyltransferase